MEQCQPWTMPTSIGFNLQVYHSDLPTVPNQAQSMLWLARQSQNHRREHPWMYPRRRHPQRQPSQNKNHREAQVQRRGQCFILYAILTRVARNQVLDLLDHPSIGKIQSQIRLRLWRGRAGAIRQEIDLVRVLMQVAGTLWLRWTMVARRIPPTCCHLDRPLPTYGTIAGPGPWSPMIDHPDHP